MARILIVEDNLDLLEVLRQLLAAEHEVETALRGEDAIGMAAGFKPELVILDLQLPGMDGIEVGRWIKRELAPAPPILVLTARASPGDEAEVRGSGCCDAYLAKPAPIDTIRRQVNELLEQRSQAA